MWVDTELWNDTVGDNYGYSKYYTIEIGYGVDNK